MAREMDARFMDGIALVDLRGPLTAGADTEGVRLPAVVAQLAEGGFAEIAMNLSAVSDLDAHGLGELVLARQAARDRGAQLTLVAPPPRVRRLLSVTRLDTVFDVYGSEAALCPAFGPFGSFERSDRSGVQFPILRSSSNQLSTT